MPKPVSPLIYHRTQKLIDLAASGAESGVQYFFPGSGNYIISKNYTDSSANNIFSNNKYD